MARDKLKIIETLNSTSLDDTGLLESRTAESTQEPTQEFRRSRYDEAFRREALRIWKTSGRSAESVARELAVNVRTLYYWAQDRRCDTDAESSTDDVAALRAENERLRAENEKLQRQKQVLRRALGIMSENSRTAAEAVVIA